MPSRSKDRLKTQPALPTPLPQIDTVQQAKIKRDLEARKEENKARWRGKWRDRGRQTSVFLTNTSVFLTDALHTQQM